MGEYIDKEKESVNKSFAGEKAKLKEMTFSQRVEYIFTYYKFHILAIVFVIVVIIYIINNRLNHVDYKLYGLVINSDTISETAQKDLEDQLGMEGHDGLSLITGLSADVDSNSTSYYNQIDIYTVAGQMDFVFTDEAGVQYLCDMGTPRDVTAVLPADLLQVWSGREIEFSQLDPDTEDTYFTNYAAIDISDTLVHDYFGLDDNICYLVITDLSGNENYMTSLYQCFYDIEMDNL